MLVNARKQTLTLLLLFGWTTIQAQEVWTLQQCIDTAQVHNKTLKIDQNNISISKQREKEAKANLIPKITANGDYKYFMELPTQLMPMHIFNPQVPEGQFRNVQFGVPHNINANIQLAMPLYNPQLYGALQQTKIASELTQLQFQKSEEQVLYDITMLYYNAQVLKHQLSFLEKNRLNTSKLLQNMQLLKEQLLAKGTDVNKVKLQAEQLDTQKEQVYNNYIQVLNVLKLTMGIALENDILIENDISFQTALDYTPQTTLAMHLIQVQNQMLHNELSVLNKTRYLPSLSLIATYGTSGFGYDKQPHDFLKFYSTSFAGLQVTYPLFNGMITQRKVNQKRLEISNNELQTQLLEDKTKVEIENSSQQRIIAQQTIVNTENQIDLAQTIYNQTVMQQKQGTANLTDVLLADNALRETQQHYLLAIIEYLKADLELKKVTGNLSK